MVLFKISVLLWGSGSTTVFGHHTLLDYCCRPHLRLRPLRRILGLRCRIVFWTSHTKGTAGKAVGFVLLCTNANGLRVERKPRLLLYPPAPTHRWKKCLQLVGDFYMAAVRVELLQASREEWNVARRRGLDDTLQQTCGPCLWARCNLVTCLKVISPTRSQVRAGTVSHGQLFWQPSLAGYLRTLFVHGILTFLFRVGHVLTSIFNALLGYLSAFSWQNPFSTGVQQ